MTINKLYSGTDLLYDNAPCPPSGGGWDSGEDYWTEDKWALIWSTTYEATNYPQFGITDIYSKWQVADHGVWGGTILTSSSGRTHCQGFGATDWDAQTPIYSNNIPVETSKDALAPPVPLVKADALKIKDWMIEANGGNTFTETDYSSSTTKTITLSSNATSGTNAYYYAGHALEDDYYTPVWMLCFGRGTTNGQHVFQVSITEETMKGIFPATRGRPRRMSREEILAEHEEMLRNG